MRRAAKLPAWVTHASGKGFQVSRMREIRTAGLMREEGRESAPLYSTASACNRFVHERLKPLSEQLATRGKYEGIKYTLASFGDL